MWQYNYSYLAHGLHGFKYIDKKRGKNGKWQYIYPDTKALANQASAGSSKSTGNGLETIKKIGNEVKTSLKDAYNKTLGSEDFKTYKKFKENEYEIIEEAYQLYKKAKRTKNLQEQQQIMKEGYEKYINKLLKEYPKVLVDSVEKSVKIEYEMRPVMYGTDEWWELKKESVNSVYKEQDKNAFSISTTTPGTEDSRKKKK